MTRRGARSGASLAVAICMVAIPAAAQVMKQDTGGLEALAKADSRVFPKPEPALIEDVQGLVGRDVADGWAAFGLDHGAWVGYVDQRTGRLEYAEGAGVPWVPGRGNSLTTADIAGHLGGKAQPDLAVLESIARGFLPQVAGMMGVDPSSLVLNPGAVFGIGAGKRWFFIAFTGAALALAIWMFLAWTGPRDRAAHAAIGLLISGGLGNLYDRIVYACVRDFLHPLPGVKMPFGLTMPLTGGREVWPYVSNIADLWLLLGISALVLLIGSGLMIRTPRPFICSKNVRDLTARMKKTISTGLMSVPVAIMSTVIAIRGMGLLRKVCISVFGSAPVVL